MSDILVRGLDEQAVKRLKERAKQNGRSLQSEAKRVLENSAGISILQWLESTRGLRKKLGRKFDNGADLIRQDRDR